MSRTLGRVATFGGLVAGCAMAALALGVQGVESGLFLRTANASGLEIAFLRDRPGGLAQDLYSMRPDGSRQRRLARNVTSFAWSPDGRHLAFVHGGYTSAEIDVINADGTNRRRLTPKMGAARSPAWSPDGSRIAFGAGENSVYVLDVRSRLVRRVTSRGSEPQWSPDGRRLAVLREDSSGYAEIYLVSVKGESALRVTRGPIVQRFDWSRDGSRIVFVQKDREIDESSICVVVVRTQRARCLTPEGLDMSDEYADVRWSPDGRRIAFAATADGNAYVMRGDGSGLRSIFRLTPFGLSWSPDGKRLALVASSALDQPEIYVMNANGTQPRRLTKNAVGESNAAWRPG